MNAMNPSLDDLLDEEDKAKPEAKGKNPKFQVPIPYKIGKAIDQLLSRPDVLEFTDKVTNDQKIVKYKGDWNDKKVLEEVQKTLPDAKDWHVARLRKEEFGVLERGNPAGRPSFAAETRALADEFNIKLEAMNQRIDVMKEAMNVIAQKVDDQFKDLRKILDGKTDAIATLQRGLNLTRDHLNANEEQTKQLSTELNKLRLKMNWGK